MPFTARVFRILEQELNKHLSFSFSIAGGYGKGRSGDPFRVTVRVRNDSALTLKNLRGSIRPSSEAVFRTRSFKLRSLRPQEEATIGELRVQLKEHSDDIGGLDRIGAVNVVAEADLSSFVFRDVGRPLTYAETPLGIAPSTARTGSRVERTFESNAKTGSAETARRWPGAIALSPLGPSHDS